MTTKKNALITGAGRGIGRRTAELLLADGWTVGVYDVSGDQSWAADVRGAVPGHLDVTDPGSWEAALEEFTGAAGGLNLLVNNAGILFGGEFMDNSYEGDSRIVDVNVKGVLYGARAAFPHLKATRAAGGRAQMVSISSAAAIYGTPDLAVYSTTKFAVRGATEALEVEWLEHGIEVKAVWPLFTKTGMLDGVDVGGMRRMGVRLTPEDVAQEIVRCIDHDNLAARTPTKVHFPVGLQAKALYAGAHFSPNWMTRLVNAKLTTSRRVGL
ncbi:SDR family oxidoreductase [Corynebacterium sphenisci]|uniref:SDR family oxidoreductase n=1 Tax=Corynebacterium sphenisci TaxID=191493 RepID=UPI0026DF4A82|nr:SDR family oxidoreductase [Corynebacterium sphenisci]MDO5731625.1 SDR family oxidoreductase [Corynebacterium sphenisci]